jgi:hypothetical protein
MAPNCFRSPCRISETGIKKDKRIGEQLAVHRLGAEGIFTPNPIVGSLPACCICSLRKKNETSSNRRKPINGTKDAGDRLGFGFPADIVDVR